MRKNYDQSLEINHNPNWSYIPDHPYRILTAGGSGSSKIDLILTLIKNEQPDFDRTYLYVTDQLKSKYQLLINGREKIGITKLKNPNAITHYSQTIDDVYENLDYNPTKKKRLLLVFDDMTADMESNKNQVL